MKPGSAAPSVARTWRSTLAKIIGIVGSRRRDSSEDFLAVNDAFRVIYQPGDRIVSGGCPQGGDRFAELIAIELAKPGHFTLVGLLHLHLIERHRIIKEWGAPFILHPANWHRDGKGAGFKRNNLIARDADILIAAVTRDRTGGTEDTIGKFLMKPSTDKGKDLILV